MVIEQARQSESQPASCKRPTEVGGQDASLYEPKNSQEEYQNNAHAASSRHGHRVSAALIRDVEDFSPEKIKPQQRGNESGSQESNDYYEHG
jgi:hypothetical protein